MSRLCAKIGQCQIELRDVNGALQTFEKQLSSATEEKDKSIRKEGQASAHANLAHAQAMLGKDNEALEALEKSDGLLKDAPTQQARNASLAGVIHFRKGDAQKALVCHQKDLELSDALVRKEDAHPLITLRAKHNCALCLCRLGKFRPARQEFDACAKLCGNQIYGTFAIVASTSTPSTRHLLGSVGVPARSNRKAPLPVDE